MARLRHALGLGLALVLVLPSWSAAAEPTRSPAATPTPVVETPSSTCQAFVIGPPALTPERRLALQRRLDRLRARAHIPGISVAIVYPDGTTWAATSGLADIADDEPVTTDTAFAVASVSKTFTAALILALRDDGKLDLESPVHRYFPDLGLDERVTIHQLLDHTSGLHDFFLDPRIDKALLGDRAHPWDTAEALSYMGKPYFKPGTGWHYSNTNYVLLGRIAELVDGRPLAEQLRERFFDPLGLGHTYEQIGEAPRGPVAHGYRLRTATDDDPTDLFDGTRMAPFTSVVTAAGAAGSLASTPTDLAHWVRALYGGRVLRPGSLTEMVGDVARTTVLDAPIPYGMGVQALTLDGRSTLGHSGRLLGFRAVVRWLPNERMAIATLTNQSRADPAAINRSLLRLALTPVSRCAGRVDRS